MTKEQQEKLIDSIEESVGQEIVQQMELSNRLLEIATKAMLEALERQAELDKTIQQMRKDMTDEQ